MCCASNNLIVVNDVQARMVDRTLTVANWNAIIAQEDIVLNPSATSDYGTNSKTEYNPVYAPPTVRGMMCGGRVLCMLWFGMYVLRACTVTWYSHCRTRVLQLKCSPDVALIVCFAASESFRGIQANCTT